MHQVIGSDALVVQVDFEVQRRAVVEQHLDVQIEQVGHAVEDLPLDGLLVGFQEVHRAVQMLQRQALRARDMDLLLEPLLPAVQLGARRADAIGHHREQCAFHIEAQTARLRLCPDHLVDAQALPQRLQHIHLAVGPRTDQTQIAVASAHDFLGRAAPKDAGCKLAQALDDRWIVRAAAVVDYARLGAAPLGGSHVLGQLQVRHRAAVGASLLGLAQIHVPKHRRPCQAKARAARQSMYLGIWQRPASVGPVKSTTYDTSTRQNRVHVPRNCQSRVRG